MKISLRKVAFIIAISAVLFSNTDRNAFCNSSETAANRYIIYKATGDRYLQNGKFELATSEYRKAIELNPKSTASYFNLAIASYSNGDLRGTISALQKLIELDPADVEAHYNLGCLKLFLRDMNGSKLAFKKALLYCVRNPEFASRINQGLEFLDEFDKLDPATQELNLFFLQASLPSQTFVS